MHKAFLPLPGYEDDTKEDSNSEYMSEDETDSQDYCKLVDMSSENDLLEHHSCFAHKLQLVVKDGLKKAGQISTVIKRCSNLVSFKMIRSVLAIPESKFSELNDAPKLSTYDCNQHCNQVTTADLDDLVTWIPIRVILGFDPD